MEGLLADALDLVPEDDGGAKGICTIAALMLCNACLLQRRLRDQPEMKTILRLDQVAGSSNPREVLQFAWEAILEKDYVPVFRPALDALDALRESKAVDSAIRVIAECANRVADSLSDLGHDHAGPLYHRILGSAKSDGAFYTNNLSAVMLARMALSEDFIDWNDSEAVANLRIMDPACGTGTLLMATLKTVKDKIEGRQELNDEARNQLHRSLVEDVLCGLDINQHGVQLAACNMTLGAPTVDYARMNLFTMPHGPQSDGTTKAGSLELLNTADDARDLHNLIMPVRSFSALDAAQVNEPGASYSVEKDLLSFPLRDLDVVIMNAPFTANENRSRKYGEEGRKAMQRHELGIQKTLERRDSGAQGVVTANSIGTFFTPLADRLISGAQGRTLAKVIPTTACINPSGLAERKYLAERFNVESVITSHDPRRPNFSENTSIHESLLVCRRGGIRSDGTNRPPTRFISLRVMPSNTEEAIEVVEAIEAGDTAKWITVYEQPELRIREGDWRPSQFLDPVLIDAAMLLEQESGLVPLGQRFQLGPAGQRIRDAFSPVGDGEGDDGYRVFWGRSADLRTTMEAVPEQSVIDKKAALAARYRNQAGYVLLAAKFDTISGRLLGIFSEIPSLGSMWVPVQYQSTSLDEAKALCAWCNSTPGTLGFLMRRGTKLTNPSFSQADLATLPVPDFKVTVPATLAEAYEHAKHMQFKPWKYATDDEVRECLDQAAAKTTGIAIETIRDWRARISREPTISNERGTM